MQILRRLRTKEGQHFLLNLAKIPQKKLWILLKNKNP